MSDLPAMFWIAAAVTALLTGPIFYTIGKAVFVRRLPDADAVHETFVKARQAEKVRR